MAKKEKVNYLIIGNSAGGIGAAEAIREVDRRGSVAIVSDEPYPAYSRPLISEYLTGKCPLEKMLFRPVDFYDKNNIQTYLGRKVVRLDVDKHSVELDDGGEIAWRKLLLATGGLPIIPEIEGIGLDRVFTLATLDDARAIAQYLKGEARAVVIGGGLIGVSATEALVRQGVEVNLVEIKERILNTILDEEASVMAETTLRQFGVKIISGHSVARINGDSVKGTTAGSVTLDDGKEIACDLVIVAIGVRPRIELTAGTGIKVNRGIVVNRYMATSESDIFACGDAAEAYDFIYGENRVIPIWPNAYLGGRIAGFNMAGANAEIEGWTTMNSLKYFGLAAASAGVITSPDSSYEVLSNRYDHIYKKIILRDGLVAGMVFVGNIEKSGIVLGLMRDRVDVRSFKQVLVADDFGLTSLPEDIWRAKLAIADSSLASSPSSVERTEELLVGESHPSREVQ